MAHSSQLLDLNFQGMPGVIGAYLLQDSGETALVEIGPTSSIETLLAGIREHGVDPDDVSKILVTHVHLDHAGASGTFMRRFPRAHLYVHEIGAPHLVDPSKLVASATRIYGDKMDTLWGPIDPVPEERVTTLTDGDVVTVGDTTLRAIYTPGHASHHVVFHDADRGAMYAGDAASVRLQGHGYVRPATPPPDIDLEAWATSIRRMRELEPRRLLLTHFGPFDNADEHLAESQQRLTAWADLVRQGIAADHEREQIIEDLRAHGDREIAEDTNDPTALERYELATPYFMSVDGLRRYWRKVVST